VSKPKLNIENLLLWTNDYTFVDKHPTAEDYRVALLKKAHEHRLFNPSQVQQLEQHGHICAYTNPACTCPSIKGKRLPNAASSSSNSSLDSQPPPSHLPEKDEPAKRIKIVVEEGTPNLPPLRSSAPPPPSPDNRRLPSPSSSGKGLVSCIPQRKEPRPAIQRIGAPVLPLPPSVSDTLLPTRKRTHPVGDDPKTRLIKFSSKEFEDAKEERQKDPDYIRRTSQRENYKEFKNPPPPPLKVPPPPQAFRPGPLEELGLVRGSSTSHTLSPSVTSPVAPHSDRAARHQPPAPGESTDELPSRTPTTRPRTASPPPPPTRGLLTGGPSEESLPPPPPAREQDLLAVIARLQQQITQLQTPPPPLPPTLPPAEAILPLPSFIFGQHSPPEVGQWSPSADYPLSVDDLLQE